MEVLNICFMINYFSPFSISVNVFSKFYIVLKYVDSPLVLHTCIWKYKTIQHQNFLDFFDLN